MTSGGGRPAQTRQRFPPVPAYYLSYGATGTGKPHAAALSMDPPAPPPENAPFVSFGVARALEETTPTLEALGLATLYDPNGDRKSELKRMLRSLKEKYEAVMSDLAAPNPTTDPPKVGEDLRLLYANVMHLIAEWRPHQAREELAKMLRDQVEAKRRALNLLREATDEAERRIPERVVKEARLSPSS